MVELECFCVQDVISAEFIHRLKSLLQRAYSLQEEFEGVLCMSEPSSHSNSHGKSQRMHKTMKFGMIYMGNNYM